MNNLGPWSTESHGAADLVLDIDYIIKWEPLGSGFQFTLCPAELVFHGVFGLKLNLDYATPTAGMCPISIHGIERTPLQFPTGSKSYRWYIPVNWPRGSLAFEAPAFTLTMMGAPIVHSRAFLSPEQRARVA